MLWLCLHLESKYMFPGNHCCFVARMMPWCNVSLSLGFNKRNVVARKHHCCCCCCSTYKCRGVRQQNTYSLNKNLAGGHGVRMKESRLQHKIKYKVRELRIVALTPMPKCCWPHSLLHELRGCFCAAFVLAALWNTAGLEGKSNKMTKQRRQTLIEFSSNVFCQQEKYHCLLIDPHTIS